MAQQIGSLYADLTVNIGSFVRGMETADRATARTAGHIRRDVGLAQASLDRFSRSSSSGIRPYGLIAASRAFERLNDRVSLLRGTMLATTAVFGGFTAALATNAILRYADTYTNLANQIRVVSDGSTDLAGQIAAVAAAADDSRASLGATATLYSRLQKAAPTRSSAEILDFVQTIQKALALGGATAQESASAAIQFSQAIASNRLGGEELRAVLETPLGLALAKGLDVTIGKLREMSIAGELTADKVLGALARVKGDVDKQFGESVQTIDQSLLKADNALIEYVGALDKTYGITRLVSGAILSFADNIDTLATAAAYLGVAFGAAFAGKLIGRRVESGIGATLGAVSAGMEKARRQVETFSRAQVNLQEQVNKSSQALASLKARSDTSFVSASEIQAVAREEARLNTLRAERLAVSQRLQEAIKESNSIETKSSGATLKAGERIIDTENKIAASKARQVVIAGQLIDAESALTRLRADQAEGKAAGSLSTPNLRENAQLEQQIAKLRKDSAKEIERTGRLETSIGEQRVALTKRVGEEEARTAETVAKARERAGKLAKEALKIREAEFEQITRLGVAQAAVATSGSANKTGEVNAASSALDGQAKKLSRVSIALMGASHAATAFGASLKVASKIGLSFFNFVGGPWGLALTTLIAGLTIFGIKSAETAASVARSTGDMEERLTRLGKLGGELGEAAEDSLESERLQGELTKVEQDIDAHIANLEQKEANINRILGQFFRISAGKGGATDFAAIEGVSAALKNVVDQAVAGDIKLTDISKTIRAIPQFNFLPKDAQDKVIKLAASMVQVSIAAKDAAEEQGRLNEEIAQGIGNLDVAAKMAASLAAARKIMAEFAQKVRDSSNASARLLADMQKITQQTELQGKVSAEAAKLMKENADLTAGDAERLAQIKVILDTINSSTDKWLMSSEAVNGSFSEMKRSIEAFANQDTTSLTAEARKAVLAARDLVEAGFQKAALDNDQRLAIRDMVAEQINLVRTEGERAVLGERQRAILDRQDELVASIRDKFKTIDGLDMDWLKGQATLLVDMEAGAKILERWRELVDGVKAGFREGAQNAADAKTIMEQTVQAQAKQAARQVELAAASEYQRGILQKQYDLADQLASKFAAFANLDPKWFKSSATLLTNIERGAQTLEAYHRLVEGVKTGFGEAAQAAEDNDVVQRRILKNIADQSRETEYQARLREAQLAQFGLVLDDTQELKNKTDIVRYVLEQINGHADGWETSTEATKTAFAQLLAMSKQFAPQMDFSKKGLGPEQLVVVDSIVKAEVRRSQLADDRFGMARLEQRTLEAQDVIIGKILEKYGTLKGVDMQSIRDAAQRVALEERRLDILEYSGEVLSNALNFEGSGGDQRLRSQVAILDKLIAQRAALETVSLRLGDAEHKLTASITSGGRALFGAAIGIDEISSKYGALESRIFTLAEGFFQGRVSARDLESGLNGVKEELEALGANSDALEPFIQDVLRAIELVGGLLAALGIINANPPSSRVGTGTQTVDPSSGVRKTSFTTTANDNAAANTDKKLDDVVRATTNGVNVASYGHTETQKAVNAAGSSITDAIHSTGAATNAGISNLSGQFSSVSQAFEALKAQGLDPAKANIRYTTGARMDLGPDIFGNPRNSGGGSGGKTYTISTKSGLDMPSRDDVADTSTVRGGTTADTSDTKNINVTVLVRPTTIGTRISPASLAEIQQAASRGANEALRALNGR